MGDDPDASRRFITLIDVLYGTSLYKGCTAFDDIFLLPSEHGVKVVALAAGPPEALFGKAEKDAAAEQVEQEGQLGDLLGTADYVVVSKVGREGTLHGTLMDFCSL